jgi:hypothetical protein
MTTEAIENIFINFGLTTHRLEYQAFVPVILLGVV